MADLPETTQWGDGIYQLTTQDFVEGGAAGVDNLPHKQLADRTAYLKNLVENLDPEVSIEDLAAGFLLPIDNGGTGANDAAQARENLGVESAPLALSSAYGAGVEYTNNSSRKIMLIVYGTTDNDIEMAGYIGASAATTLVSRLRIVNDASYDGAGTITFIVPPGWKFKITVGTGTYTTVIERAEAWEL